MKDVITVPQDKCPLDILAEMGDSIANAWIYFHANLVKKLVSDASSFKYTDFMHRLTWDATDDIPETTLILTPSNKHWLFCQRILAEDISFKDSPEEPERFIFLKMAED